MPTISEDHTTTAASITVKPITPDSALMLLAIAFKIAVAVADQSFDEAIKAESEAKRLRALSDHHANHAESLAEEICGLRADGLVGAKIQADAVAYVGGLCWDQDRYDDCSEPAQASIRRVLAMHVDRIGADA